jgi:hypothetical protein|tara:strand:+ start:485 stop:604 length:120 start_codon:yes stop_codon:yes gene_type:complete
LCYENALPAETAMKIFASLWVVVALGVAWNVLKTLNSPE